MNTFFEFVVGSAALAWLEGIGWPVQHGADIAPDAERFLDRAL